MAESKRTDDQLPIADFAKSASNTPERSALREWIEGCRIPTNDAARPRLVPHRSNNLQGPRIMPPNSLAATESSADDREAAAPLPSGSEIAKLRSRWNNIQADFVDEPRRSVQEADKLVGDAVQRLAEGFANERASLQKQWDSGDKVSTEDLRVALQRYRAFIGRLLSVA
jgi:hypothetical protein